jgi:hypothetical protein
MALLSAQWLSSIIVIVRVAPGHVQVYLDSRGLGLAVSVERSALCAIAAQWLYTSHNANETFFYCNVNCFRYHRCYHVRYSCRFELPTHLFPSAFDFEYKLIHR